MQFLKKKFERTEEKTMAEYLERETAVMRLMQDGCSAKNVQSIMELPAADVAPVRHGKWVHSRYENCSEQFEMVKCSCCGRKALLLLRNDRPAAELLSEKG